jgi:hypothetical protein
MCVSIRHYVKIIDVDIRTCTSCGEGKPATDFYIGQGRCKPCKKRVNAEQYRNGTSASRSYDGVFAKSIKRLYGMTMDDYNRMLRQQAYRCAVCRRPETKLRRNGEPYRLQVDHDHVTQKPRALLCERCNRVVWALEENHTLIPAIFAYVEQFRASLAVEPEGSLT